MTRVQTGAPILASRSDNGTRWSASQEVSGFSPACRVRLYGAPNECDLNQLSVPTVAPGGEVYVGREPVPRGVVGGRRETWSAPSRAGVIFDINYPQNVDGRDTLTGCQFRVAAPGNLAADPSDPSGNTLVAAWADNRNGDELATNSDVFLARSTDGGKSWTQYTVDGSPNDQLYAWAAVAPEGRVDVGYMDRAWSAGQHECKYGFSLTRMTFNAAGEITSQMKPRVDSKLSDPGHSRWFSAATGGSSRFLGDYNGVAVGADGVTWSLWTDHRKPNPPTPFQTHGQHAVGARTP